MHQRHPCARRIIGFAGHPPHHLIRTWGSDREEPDLHESQADLIMDLRKSFPRSMRVKMEGYVHLARMIDKCRAVLAGTEDEYIYPCPMDDRLMEFAGITADQFTASVKANLSDKAVGDWFTRTAKAHAPTELDAWNRMMLTRG